MQKDCRAFRCAVPLYFLEGGIILKLGRKRAARTGSHDRKRKRQWTKPNAANAAPASRGFRTASSTPPRRYAALTLRNPFHIAVPAPDISTFT
jgi:hypothetical protein